MRCSTVAVGYRSAACEDKNRGDISGHRLVASGSGIRAVHRHSHEHILEKADRWSHQKGHAAIPRRAGVQLPEAFPSTFDEFMQMSDNEQTQPAEQLNHARARQNGYSAPARMAEQPVGVAPSLASVLQPADVETVSQTESSTADVGEASRLCAVDTGDSISQMLAQMAVSDWKRSAVEIASTEAWENKQALEAEVRSLEHRLEEALREGQNHRVMLDVVQEERWEVDRKCKDAMASLDARTCEKIVLEQRVETLKTELDNAMTEIKKLKLSAERDGEDLCVICMDAAPCYAVVPCGHLSFCESCRARSPMLCPVCRTQASMLLRLYRP